MTLYDMVYSFSKELLMALVSSYIFYILVIYFPQKKAIFNTNSFLLQNYKYTKIKIIESILMALERRLSSNFRKENCFDYNYMRSLISDDDINKIRSLNENAMKDLAKDINFYLYDIRGFLSIELSKRVVDPKNETMV